MFVVGCFFSLPFCSQAAYFSCPNLAAPAEGFEVSREGFRMFSFFLLLMLFYCKVDGVYFAGLTSEFKATRCSWTPARFPKLKAPLLGRADLYYQSLTDLQRNAKMTSARHFPPPASFDTERKAKWECKRKEIHSRQHTLECELISQENGSSFLSTYHFHLLCSFL